MDVVSVVVFLVCWLVFGAVGGFMVYVTPYASKLQITAAIVVSWLMAVCVAFLVYMKRNPRKEEPPAINDAVQKPEEQKPEEQNPPVTENGGQE